MYTQIHPQSNSFTHVDSPKKQKGKKGDSPK